MIKTKKLIMEKTVPILWQISASINEVNINMLLMIGVNS